MTLIIFPSASVLISVGKLECALTMKFAIVKLSMRQSTHFRSHTSQFLRRA
jgi:hypothetical protein